PVAGIEWEGETLTRDSRKLIRISCRHGDKEYSKRFADLRPIGDWRIGFRSDSKSFTHDRSTIARLFHTGFRSLAGAVAEPERRPFGRNRDRVRRAAPGRIDPRHGPAQQLAQAGSSTWLRTYFLGAK